MPAPYISYAALRFGVYQSNNFSTAGDYPCWTPINTGLPAYDLGQGYLDIFRVDPTYPDRVQYLTIDANPYGHQNTSACGVYKRDAAIGGVWTHILSLATCRTLTSNYWDWHVDPYHSREGVHGLACDPTTPGHMVATYGFFCAYGFSGIHPNQFVLESVDYGVTWTLAYSMVAVYAIGEIDIYGTSVFFSTSHSPFGPQMHRSLSGAAGPYDSTVVGDLGSSGWTASPMIDPHDPTRAWTGEYSNSVVNDFDLSWVGGAPGALAVTQVRPTGVPLYGSYFNTKTHIDKLWIDPAVSGHMRLQDDLNIYVTDDNWATIDHTFTIPPASIVRPMPLTTPADDTAKVVAGGLNFSYVYASPDDVAGPFVSRVQFPGPTPSPTVCDIPYDVGPMIRYGLWVGNAAAPLPCFVAEEDPDSIAARYFCRLRAQNGATLAWFDDWDTLEYQDAVNEVGYYAFSIRDDDPRIALFELDGQFEVWRSVPGAGIDWYLDFVGLHVDYTRHTTQDGRRVYTSNGVGLNDLLARRVIAYSKTTAGAYKNNYAETVMKEHVNENAGPLALYGLGRWRDGVIPGFTVEASTGAGQPLYVDYAWQNLLDVVKTISALSKIDFKVAYTVPALFEFQTVVDQLGDDRSLQDIDPTTGKKTNGLIPVLFSVGKGTVQDIEYSNLHSSEYNVVFISGSPGGAEITTHREDTTAIERSPLNQREMAIDASDQTTLESMQAQADAELARNAYVEKFEITPLQQPTCLYGRHYFLGDLVTARYDMTVRHIRILAVQVRVARFRQEISLTFSNVVRPLYA